MAAHDRTIAVLGLGSMGAALAQTYLKADFVVHAWNRTRDRPEVRSVANAGAELAESPTCAVGSAQVVVVCVLNYDTVYSIFQDISESALANKTIVNLTNGTPKEARAMSEWAKRRGVSIYVDGGIMATPPLVGTEKAFIFYSGETQDQIDNIQDFLEPLGRIDYVGEDPGAAALHDLALLSGMYGMLGGAMTTIALLSKRRAGGEETSATVETKLIPWLQALLPSLVSTARSVEADDFAAHGHPNAMRYSSLRNLGQTCEEEGVQTGAFDFLTQAVGDTVKEGAGGEGFAMVARQFLKDM